MFSVNSCYKSLLVAENIFAVFAVIMTKMLRHLQKILSRAFADRHHLRVKTLKKEVGYLKDVIAIKYYIVEEWREGVIKHTREVIAGNKVRMYILSISLYEVTHGHTHRHIRKYIQTCARTNTRIHLTPPPPPHTHKQTHIHTQVHTQY